MVEVRSKILQQSEDLLEYPDPIVFMSLVVDTSGCLYEYFIRLLFLYAHREVSALDNELQEESYQFRFLRTV
jgi:hypothetical protein